MSVRKEVCVCAGRGGGEGWGGGRGVVSIYVFVYECVHVCACTLLHVPLWASSTCASTKIVCVCPCVHVTCVRDQAVCVQVVVPG